MGKIKVIALSDEQRVELEKGYRNGKSHTFRQRCQMILLKSEKRTSLEIAEVMGCCEMVVNNWLTRYLEEDIEGLRTRAGRGRPPILSQQNAEHLRRVKAEIEKHPNSVKTVVAALDEGLDLQMHPETLKRLSGKKWLSILSRTNVAQESAGGFRKNRQRSRLKQIVAVLPGWLD